ncbi:MAG: M1 family metallopeptidase [Gammaproteobacteria bacterium]
MKSDSDAPAHGRIAAQVQRQDVHSFAELDKFRITHLDLDLEVSFGCRELNGVVTLSVQRMNKTADPLVLDTRALAIHAVEGSEDKRDFTTRPYEIPPPDSLLGAPLAIHLGSADRFVRIAYTTSVQATALQWLEPAQTASGRFPFLFTQSQEIHARSWLPLQDSPSVRVTFSARIRTPEQLVAVMGADHDPPGVRTGVYEFQMLQPIPPYLIALAVGDIDFASMGERTGVYAEPSVLQKAVREFSDTERMLRVVEGLYGQYRWNRFDLLVLPPSFPFGGMEIPKLTFVTPTLITGDKSLVSLIAHEMAHAWSGNLVTNATWSDFWLNEGFTTYIEHRIIEQVYGRQRADMEEVMRRRKLEEEMSKLAPRDQILHIDLEGRDPDNGATRVPYEKGALFLKSLEHNVGRQRFDQFLRGYFQHFAFQSVTTAQVLEYVKKNLLHDDPDLVKSLHFREWILDPGLPVSAPSVSSQALASVEQLAAKWIEGSIQLTQVDFADWNAQQLLHFLNSLPLDVGVERMEQLDRHGHFTSSPNSEILHRWLLMAARNQFEPAYGALEHFLRTVGRRKYVKPLYEELVKSPESRRRAERVYADVRPRYHPITRAAIDEILTPRTPQ